MINLKNISAFAFALLITALLVDNQFVKYPLLIVSVVLFVYTVIRDRQNRKSS